MKTTSRGNVTINSTDTSDNPIVSVNWLLTSTDQQLAVMGVKRARALSASFGIADGPEVAPGPAVQTDAQILQYVLASAAASHHVVATCKMGQANNTAAVVDSHGRVLGGVSGLRIVDASAMALLPPGQPMATVCELARPPPLRFPYGLPLALGADSLTVPLPPCRHARGEIGSGYFGWTVVIRNTWIWRVRGVATYLDV